MTASKASEPAATAGTLPSEPGRRRLVVSASIAVLALVWAAAVAVRGIPGTPGVALDADWAATIAAARTPLLIAVGQAFAWLGVGPGSILVAVVVGLLLWWRRRLRTALAFVAISLLADGDVRLMKLVDLRERPHGGLWDGIGSFPSGHTANAAVIAVTLGVVFHRTGIWITGFAYVAAMAVSRTVVEAHWLTDTLGGAACGAAFAALAWTLLPAGFRGAG